MHFFHDDCITDFCSCKIGIPYILYISSLLAGQLLAVVSASLRLLVIIAMDGMYAGFAGAKACPEKSLFLEAT